MGTISFSALGNVFRVPDLRTKLFFTLAMLAIYRLGTFITVPGISGDGLKDALKGGIFDFLNLWTGGGLGNAAIFGLGIMPYITASIITQLMTVVVPQLAELQKEGEMGYMKINRITRYLAVVLARVAVDRLLLRAQARRPSATASRCCRHDFRPRVGERHRAHAAVRRLDDRRHRAAHVDRRAHHPARHRQRHVAAHLLVDHLRHRPGHPDVAAAADRHAHCSCRCCSSRSPPPSCSSRRASAASRCSTPSAWSAAR